MEDPIFTVVCRRHRGRWEITIPEVPNFALVLDRLEDVPEAARDAIAAGRGFDAAAVRVLLDVHGG